jgi:hypothetical protein
MLTVRQGTQNGDRLRMRGFGVPSLGGRGRGDQYVHIRCGRFLGLQGWGLGGLGGLGLAAGVMHVCGASFHGGNGLHNWNEDPMYGR